MPQSAVALSKHITSSTAL